MSKSNRLFFTLNFGIFGFLFFHLAKEMLKIQPDGWYVGQVNLYGDLVFHLSFINKFLQSNEFLVDSPIFPSGKPNYPIFADFVTAQLARFTGVDFALSLTTLLAGLIVLTIARWFILQFVKNEKIVFIAFLIFFLNGGFGFYYFFQDFASSQKSFFDFILSLPHEYTDLKSRGYWWINTYLAYFLPQRGFLFAFPITLTVLSLLYVGIKKNLRQFFIIAGLLAGTLPMVQAHSLFVIFIVCAFFAPATIVLTKFKREVIINWFLFALPAIAIALPIFNALSSESNPLKYFRFDPGWTSNENILWFWLKNLGLFGPLLILSLLWLFKKSRYLFWLYLPFLAIFVLANIFVFQPWDFDNSKLLVYWFFASTIIVAYFIHDQFLTEGLIKKIIGLVILFFLIFSGSLDLIRTFTPVTYYRIFTRGDLEIAASVINLTPKDSLFVTSANHNHPIPALSGRSTLLGFHGWVWSHGLDYQKRSQDIIMIYQGGGEAEKLIRQYQISFITIGSLEKSSFSINESYFSKYPAIFLGNNWIIYDVSNLWSNGNR